MDLEVDHYSENGIEIVSIKDGIDTYTAPKMVAFIGNMIKEQHYRIILDLERAEWLDGTGTWALVSILKRVRYHDGSLKLVVTQKEILKMFRITGMIKVFDIYSSVSDAIDSF